MIQTQIFPFHNVNVFFIQENGNSRSKYLRTTGNRRGGTLAAENGDLCFMRKIEYTVTEKSQNSVPPLVSARLAVLSPSDTDLANFIAKYKVFGVCFKDYTFEQAGENKVLSIAESGIVQMRYKRIKGLETAFNTGSEVYVLLPGEEDLNSPDATLWISPVKIITAGNRYVQTIGIALNHCKPGDQLSVRLQLF